MHLGHTTISRLSPDGNEHDHKSRQRGVAVVASVAASATLAVLLCFATPAWSAPSQTPSPSETPIPASQRRLHRQIDLTCPDGGRRHVRLIQKRSAAALSVGVEQAYVEVRCQLADGTPHGPIAELRRYMQGRLSQLRRSPAVRARHVVRTGAMAQGRRDGTWLQLDHRGRELGQFALSKGTGTWRAWHGSGTVAITGALKNDLRDGPWRYRFNNGTVAVAGSYRSDQRAGEWRWQYASGAPLRSISFKGGQRHGLYTDWWLSGNKRMEGQYRRGLRNGPWLRWSRDGQLQGINRLTNGAGAWSTWYATGTLQASGPVRRDKRHGLWRTWYDTGVRREEGEYRDGSRVGAWRRFNKDGEPATHQAASNRRTRKAPRPTAASQASRRAQRLKLLMLGRSSGSTLRQTHAPGGGTAVGIAVGGRQTAIGAVSGVTIAFTSQTPGVKLSPSQVALLRGMMLRCGRRLRVAKATISPQIRRGGPAGSPTVQVQQGRRGGRHRSARRLLTTALRWTLSVRSAGSILRARRVLTPTTLVDRRGLGCTDYAASQIKFAALPPGPAYTVALTVTLIH